ncbi:MAG TPA: hypothetical protein VGY54_09405, partial [Polyangiaceae bacterium]|nr:hypothetical protein [Polyangiaceae bacterium]
MTSVPEPAPPATEAAHDPHAPKLLPDDPRLGLGRPGARTLRTGPIVLIVACLLGAVMLAVALALEPAKSKANAPGEPSGAPAPPAVPESIRNAQPAHGAPLSTKGVAPAQRSVRASYEEDPSGRAARELDQKARGAGILFESAPGAAEGSEMSSRQAPPFSEAAAASAPSPLLTASDPNLQDRKNAFAGGQAGVKAAEYL